MLDMNAHYTVDGYPGIAFRLVGYKEVWTEDYEWSGIAEVDTDWVRAVMVGDDRVHEVEVTDLTLLSDDDYCPECGQVGCGHGR
jgi:hypothetical protein